MLETVTAGCNPTIFNFVDLRKAFDTQASSLENPPDVRPSRANNIYSAESLPGQQMRSHKVYI